MPCYLLFDNELAYSQWAWANEVFCTWFPACCNHCGSVVLVVCSTVHYKAWVTEHGVFSHKVEPSSVQCVCICLMTNKALSANDVDMFACLCGWIMLGINSVMRCHETL